MSDNNKRIREVLHSLREFYPDAETRGRLHYSFVHSFLWQYVAQNPQAFFGNLLESNLPGGPIPPTRFIQSRWTMFENLAGQVPRPGLLAMLLGRKVTFRRVTDLSMALYTLGCGPLALIRMPPPEGPTQAYYIGIVLLADSAPARVRYFTLELIDRDTPTANVAGVICEWIPDGTHRNHGALIRVDGGASFVHAIQRLVSSPRHGGTSVA